MYVVVKGEMVYCMEDRIPFVHLVHRTVNLCNKRSALLGNKNKSNLVKET